MEFSLGPEISIAFLYASDQELLGDILLTSLCLETDVDEDFETLGVLSVTVPPTSLVVSCDQDLDVDRALAVLGDIKGVLRPWIGRWT